MPAVQLRMPGRFRVMAGQFAQAHALVRLGLLYPFVCGHNCAKDSQEALHITRSPKFYGAAADLPPLGIGVNFPIKVGLFSLPGGPCTQEAQSAREAAVAHHPIGLFRAPWWTCPHFGDEDSSPAEPRVPAAEVMGCPFPRPGDGKTAASALSISSYFLTCVLEENPAAVV